MVCVVCVCVWCVCVVCVCVCDKSTAGLCFSVSQGLHAIHSCFLGSHGNLKSTECYVDSHWVVHVSGMGLSFLKSNQYYFTEPSGEGGCGSSWGRWGEI